MLRQKAEQYSRKVGVAGLRHAFLAQGVGDCARAVVVGARGMQGRAASLVPMANGFALGGTVGVGSGVAVTSGVGSMGVAAAR